MHSYQKVLAALAMGAMAVAAQASTQAQVSLSNLSYQLKDLNTADGVSAALSFGAMPGGAQLDVDLQGQNGWTATPQSGVTFYQANFGAHVTAHDYRYNSSGAVTLAGLSSTFQLAGTGFGALEMRAQVDAGQRSSAQGFYNRDFTLGAGTQVTFSMLVSGSLSGDASPIVLSPGFTSDLHSVANIYGYMAVGSLSNSLSLAGNNSFMTDTDGFEQSLSGQLLSLTVKNSGSTSKNYQLTLGAAVWASELTSPVPEPASYALMALGLVGVAAAARRRQPR